MISFQKKEHSLIRRYPIIGSRRLSNYWWSTVLFLGGYGFLLTGISSFFNRNLLIITPTEQTIQLKENLSASNLVFQKTNTLSSFEIKPMKSLDLLTNRKDLSIGASKYLVPRSIADNFVYTDSTIESIRMKKLLSIRLPVASSSFSLSPPFLFRPMAQRMSYFGLLLGESSSKSDSLSLFFFPPFLSVGKTGRIENIQISDILLRIPLQGKERRLTLLKLESQKLLSLQKVKNTASNVALKSSMGVSTFWCAEQLKGEICIGDLSLKIRNGIPILPFFPQGLVLSFYGFLGLCFSFHLWFTLFWKIGGGFNEVNGKEKYIRIFRWGQPGKNRRIDLKYSNKFINTIKIEFRPKPALFLCIKGDKKIPLTRLGEFIPLEDLETQAAELTSLLQVPLEIEEL